MKRFIKAIILHLPIISGIYRRYTSVLVSLAQQKKDIKKLKELSSKQEKTVKALLTKIDEKDRQIERLSQYVLSFEKRAQEDLRKSRNAINEEMKTALNQQAERNSAELESLHTGLEAAVKQADEKFVLEKEEREKLDNKFSSALTAERLSTQKLLRATENSLNVSIRRRYFQGLHEDDYKKALEAWLFESIGEVADIENPKTFNEKVQWMKLRADREPYTTLADKYRVRDWIADKIGEKYLIPLLGAWDRFDDIDFASLPDKFVLKANHGCKYNYIVYDKSKFDINDARNKFNKWMKENFAWNSLELQYKNIPRKIIAEEYIENSDENLNDYKIFCFNGKPAYIMFLTERNEGLKMAFFDLEWNLVPFTYSFPQYTGKVERPQRLDEMIRLAEVLAEGFPHVRVDFYILNDGSIKFGEMTFSTASGFCNWQPKEYNRILGDMIDLPEA